MNLISIYSILHRDFIYEQDFSFSNSEEEMSLYDRIIWNVNSQAVKPTLEHLETEVVLEIARIAERVRLEEEARLAELARVEALTARFNAIEDINYTLHLSGLEYSNSALLLRDIIRDNDEVKLAALEAKRVEANAFVNQQEINRVALKYLADTDYKIVREMEGGEACSVEVKAERAAARLRIVR